jgi:hypothetical protein
MRAGMSEERAAQPRPLSRVGAWGAALGLGRDWLSVGPERV